MKEEVFQVREAKVSEYGHIGKVLVNGYSALKDFPGPDEIPDYYDLLLNIGDFVQRPCTELLVAVSKSGQVAGAVVFFSDIRYYSAREIDIDEPNTSGFRLLAVDPNYAGMGVGKLLSMSCMKKAQQAGHKQLIIHSTAPMVIARKMYEKLGFVRSQDLDFHYAGIHVMGYRLKL